MTRTEPPPDLDLAYEGRIRNDRPSMNMAEHRIHVALVLLESIERIACDHMCGGYPLDVIREQIARARYELQELEAGR